MRKVIILVCCLFIIILAGCDDDDYHLLKLKSTNITNCLEGIYYVGQEKDENALPMLHKLLESTNNKKVRQEVIRALGKIAHSTSADPILKGMVEMDAETKILAIEAVSKVKDPKVISIIAKFLDDPKLQLTAIWAIGHIGHESGMPYLTALLNHSDKFVRYNAYQALKRIDIME